MSEFVSNDIDFENLWRDDKDYLTAQQDPKANAYAAFLEGQRDVFDAVRKFLYKAPDTATALEVANILMPGYSCPVCPAKGNRCIEEDGSFLPVGQVHGARRFKQECIDCITCSKQDDS